MIPSFSPCSSSSSTEGNDSRAVLEQRHARLPAEHQVAQVRTDQPAAAGKVVQNLVEPVSGEGRIVVGEQRQIGIVGKHRGYSLGLVLNNYAGGPAWAFSRPVATGPCWRR